MVNDGGDENTLNIVGEIGNYIIGIGAPDSDSLKEVYTQGEWPKDMNNTKYELPYDTWHITKRGYIFKIKDDPSEYIYKVKMILQLNAQSIYNLIRNQINFSYEFLDSFSNLANSRIKSIINNVAL